MNDFSRAAPADASPQPQSGTRGRLPFLAWMARLSTTRANGRVGLVADAITGIVLLVAGIWRKDTGLLTALLTIACGLLLFSFVEYCFHRWLFHGRDSIMEQGHTKHHEDPLGYDALPFFLPPLGLLVLAGLFALAMPGTVALLLAGSLAGGYAAYGLSHTAIHSMRFRRPLTRRWAAMHHIHHYHPESNFGVTTPLWDIVLGTRYAPKARSAADRREQA